MSGLVEDLALWLDVGSTGLTRGTNLFAHTLPEGTAAALLLSLETGSIPNLTYGSTFPIIASPMVTVTARSTRPAGGANPVPTAALRLSWIAYRKLSGLVNVTSTSGSGRVFLAAVPMGEPGYAGQDAAGRAHFEQSWTITHTPTTGDY